MEWNEDLADSYYTTKSSESQPNPGKWLYSQSGVNYLTDSMVREVDQVKDTSSRWKG